MLTLAEIAELRRTAEAELQKYPNVVAVDYGVKEQNGQTTDQVALRIYVSEKKNASDLRPEEMIPSQIMGVPTDVVTVPTFVNDHCEDLDTHNPLIGGVSVGNLKTGALLGTLGFFVTINDAQSPNNVGFVSNHHVLMSGGAAVGATVFQPKLTKNGGGLSVATDLDGKPIEHPVAVIKIEGGRVNQPFTYPTETELRYWVDASVAQIDVCLSSWCHTNMGTAFKHDIRILALDSKNDITGVARAQPAAEVYKVGRTTSRTKGRVISLLAPLGNAADPAEPKNVMIIEALELGSSCEGALRFSDSGDSGAALVNSQRELIGVVFAHDPVNPNRSYACHIAPVLDKLKVTPITTARPHVAEETLSSMPGIIEGQINDTALLRHRLTSAADGREIFELIEAHRSEVVQLVNHRRPVTVAWHRSKGPGFLAHVVEGVRNAGHPVPREIDGVKREVLIRNMAQVLTEHGSPALRAAVERHLSEALDHADSLDNPHQLLEQLNGHEKT